MKTYSLGMTGMMPMPGLTGKFVETPDYLREIAEWQQASTSNRLFAEKLLQQADDDITKKNKRIQELTKQLDEKNDE